MGSNLASIIRNSGPEFELGVNQAVDEIIRFYNNRDSDGIGDLVFAYFDWCQQHNPERDKDAARADIFIEEIKQEVLIKFNKLSTIADIYSTARRILEGSGAEIDYQKLSDIAVVRGKLLHQQYVGPIRKFFRDSLGYNLRDPSMDIEMDREGRIFRDARPKALSGYDAKAVSN